MTTLYVGLLLFFGLHFYTTFRSRTAGQDIKSKIGEAKYMGLYSLGSGIGLGLMIWGYMQAPITEYVFAGVGNSRPIIIGLMLLAFILLLASQLPKGNIKQTLKHPMLIGISLWAIAHLLDGANLKQVLLFGSFLTYSVVDIVVASSRTASTKASGSSEGSVKYDVLAIVLGVAAFFITIVWLHSGLSNYWSHF